jgi:hypothetical protein
MAFVMRFAPKGMTAAKYDEVIKQLAAAGADAPAGRLYHVAWGDKNELRVTDVWDTMENFEAFGKVLMPILQDLGIDAEQPEIIDVYNIIAG